MKKPFHDISFWFNCLVHRLACFHLWRFFPWSVSTVGIYFALLWYFSLFSCVYLPQQIHTRTYKRHRQPVLPTGNPFMWPAFGCQVHEVAFLLNLVASQSDHLDAQRWPTLFARAILFLPLCPGCPGGYLSPQPPDCWNQQSRRPSLDPVRLWPYLDFEDNLTLELLIMENDRLSVTGNLEERLSEMCPQCQVAARQESLRGIPPSAFC